MTVLDREVPGDAGRIERLLDLCFGPDRHLKTCQRLRDGQMPAPGLALVLRDGDAIVGTLRFWDVMIGHSGRALLLGPLAIDPSLQGSGLGSKLIRHGLNLSAVAGHRAVILVGDPAYYQRFGFSAGLVDGVSMPGPVERPRFQGLELSVDALRGSAGMVCPALPSVGWPMQGSGAVSTTAPVAGSGAQAFDFVTF